MSSNETHAAVVIGPATIGLDRPVTPSDAPWSSRIFRGRVTVDHARVLAAALSNSPPAALPLLVYGEPAVMVMVRSMRTLMSEEAHPALLTEIEVVRYVRARPWRVGA